MHVKWHQLKSPNISSYHIASFLTSAHVSLLHNIGQNISSWLTHILSPLEQGTKKRTQNLPKQFNKHLHLWRNHLDEWGRGGMVRGCQLILSPDISSADVTVFRGYQLMSANISWCQHISHQVRSADVSFYHIRSDRLMSSYITSG